MNKQNVTIPVVLFLCSLMLASGVLAQETPTIDWWTFSSGGGPATSSMAALNGMLAQPVIGSASNGSISLGAGYLYGVEMTVEYQLYLPLVLKNF